MTKAQFSLPEASAIKSSNQLHNVNSYEYLRYLTDYLFKLKHITKDNFREIFPKKLQKIFIRVLKEMRKPYKGYYCYGELYTDFIMALENYVEKNPKDNNSCINILIEAVFINNNSALEHTYAVIKPTIKQNAGNTKRIASAISATLPDMVMGERGINLITPAFRETNEERFFASFIREDFKPQNSTSQPSIRQYNYKKFSDPTELRLGTQAQWHEGKPRVSPLFKRFIQIQSQNLLRDRKTEITHIYFNDLGRDSLPLSFSLSGLFKKVEKSHESTLTKQLEALETKYKNIAVITLPSDKGIMSHSYIYNQTIVKNPYDKLLNIALNESKDPVQDFYISESIRIKLFNNKEKEKSKLDSLLSISFGALGFTKESQLTNAQLQAVWFYFTKYTLTNFIIRKLNPLTFQMSCKDGIDRAGVHSALYNLMKSFRSKRTPMSLSEFEQAIDAASAMVKGRGMNHHRDCLWNVINCYVNAKGSRLEKNENQRWLLKWREDNCPPGVQQLPLSTNSKISECEDAFFYSHKESITIDDSYISNRLS